MKMPGLAGHFYLLYLRSIANDYSVFERVPVRVKKTRQNKNLKPGSDSIRTGL
jgi:hypothetical protein